MRPFKQTIAFADALRLTLEAAVPIERRETIEVREADGRVLAQDVTAVVDVPPFDRAAMDGYAVRSADTAGATTAAPTALRCRSRIFAGQVSRQVVEPGECAEIATGAPLPPGADAVVMVEDTSTEGGTVLVRVPAAPRQHVGVRAGDLVAGGTVARAGRPLTPAMIGALSAVGVRSIEVFSRPTIALVSTGNEIVEPGDALGPGEIYDVNRRALGALVARHGGRAVPLSGAGDTVEELGAVLTRARAHDIVVFSGGSSVGSRDLVLDVLRAQGDVLYHGIAVKPGKPTAFARVDGVPVFGMPGNPTSCLSNGYLLLVPFIRRVARLPAWEPRVVELPLARAIRSSADRHQFYTVRIEDGRVEPAFKGSSAITSMADADGYIEIAAGTSEIAEGAVVRVTLF